MINPLRIVRDAFGVSRPSPIERIASDPAVQFHRFERAIFDDVGFLHPQYPDYRIHWRAIRRVALGYQIATWRRWDFNFCTFQAQDPLEGF